MLNFEMLRECEKGTVLVDSDGVEKYFYGFNMKESKIITSGSDICEAIALTWNENEIKYWHIKKKEPKKIGEIAWFLNQHNGGSGGMVPVLKGSELFTMGS